MPEENAPGSREAELRAACPPGMSRRAVTWVAARCFHARIGIVAEEAFGDLYGSAVRKGMLLAREGAVLSRSGLSEADTKRIQRAIDRITCLGALPQPDLADERRAGLRDRPLETVDAADDLVESASDASQQAQAWLGYAEADLARAKIAMEAASAALDAALAFRDAARANMKEGQP